MTEKPNQDLKVGSGFKLSALGMKRLRKVKSRTGIIVGISPTGSSFRVVLQGRKYPITLHESYVEPNPDEAGAYPKRHLR